MNWTRILLGSIAAGIAMNIADFVMHGVIMGPTYQRYSQVFSQTQANPAWFFAIAIAIAFTMAIFFDRTRGAWAAGWMGGATFGFFAGLVRFFTNFYSPLTIDGFPYFLSWCWGGIGLITSVIGGAVLGTIVKR